MAIKTKYDLVNNLEPLTIILANRGGDKFGQLKINDDSVELTDRLNDVSEISFTVNKYVDEEIVPLWDKIVDFKLIYCKEMDMWFEIKVELDEATETVKTVFGTQLGYAELSQIMLYEMHINEEGDPNWNPDNEEYKSTILYDAEDSGASLLDRLLADKAPHYSIAHVDYTIANEQRTFSFDGTSICDALQEIAEEIGCLFILGSNSDENGMPQRTISAYDLQQFCNDCNYRGEYTDECPKCGSKDIKIGYGEDTSIFVTSDELATEGIQLVTDTDSVKNCFKLEGGDDLMTATIRNCNPNGTDYIWYFSDAIKEDMPSDLVDRIEAYDEEYKKCYNSEVFTIPDDIRNKYNALVEQYGSSYNVVSTCIDCGNEGYFESKCPSCYSGNVLNGKSLKSINDSIEGYSSLMNAYYDTIDLDLYLESGLLPSGESLKETTVEEEADKLTSLSLSPVAVDVKDASIISEGTANSAVLSMAKVLVRSIYKVEIEYSEYDKNTNIWRGKFRISSYSDENKFALSDDCEVEVGNDNEVIITQQLEKILNKNETDNYSIVGLFEKSYDDFCVALKSYALNSLKSFYEVCDDCIDILIKQGAGKSGTKLYEDLYKPYYDKRTAINNEMVIRENEIAIIEDLQNSIGEHRTTVQEELDFQSYIGEDLWKVFCAYRREDKYSNSNYISDGLNNAELFKRAQEFIEVAENEIYKSSELQCSISTTLNNLMTIPKFKPLVKSFDLGNWIRVRADDNIYKLRLLEYSLNYGEVGEIPVEFSEVSKIKNGYTDVQDILSQASSMATSYDSIQKQAKQGNEARSTIREWLEKGLNSAYVQIQSNDNEEITLTKNGLLGRSYNDILGEYSPEQVKLTHNIMAYTDDGWKTVKQAIGKHDYMRYDSTQKNFIKENGFGLSAEFVTAGYISGSQIIGGDIYSDNYSESEQKGSYINLRDGTFNFGGGKITFNGTELTVNPDNGMITESDVEKISTRITSDAISTAKISANNITTGTLSADVGLTAEKGKIGGWNIAKTGLDKTSGNYTVGMQSTATSTDLAFYVKKGADDIFFVRNNGEIKATAGNIAGWTIGKVQGYSAIYRTGADKYTVGMAADGAKYPFFVRYEDGDESFYPFYVQNDGKLFARGADIEGYIATNEGYIGGWSIGTDDENQNGIYKNTGDYKVGLRSSDNPNHLAFYVKDNSGNDMFFVRNSGEILATKGKIGGWNIGTVKTNTNEYSAIYRSGADGYTVGMAADGATYPFFVKKDNDNSYPFFVRNNGYLYAKDAYIEGQIVASSGNIGNWNIIKTGDDKGSLYSENGDYKAWIHTPGYDGVVPLQVYAVQKWTGRYENEAKTYNTLFKVSTSGEVDTTGLTFGGQGVTLKKIIVGTCTLPSSATGEQAVNFESGQSIPSEYMVYVFMQPKSDNIVKVNDMLTDLKGENIIGFEAQVISGNGGSFNYIAFAF